MIRNSILILTIAITIFLIASAPVFATSTEIGLGETIEGRFERNDDQLEDDDCYYDSYIIDCEPGTLVRITETSRKVDSYLIVTGPRGEQWENDDYEDGSFDSQVTVLISDPDDFEIIATTYSEETGRYELTVEELIKPDFYGVFVGIDDYGAELDDAPLCDEDAENLFDAFVRSGIMDEENGIVLTNRHAELIDVENAMHDMAQRVGPDDVFIFFFSGHGDRVEAISRNIAGEIDEYDETLVLRDTDLVDDHLAEMLGEIDAALKVGVLDACHAGGVAEDISRFPKTVGFASSEEDVLSDFAPGLDAGGYLSVFFMEAIGGDADLDGDGIIMIGELARFLSMRFYEDGPETDQAMNGYPELVHERGLVTQETIFYWWDTPAECWEDQNIVNSQSDPE